jgi:hypothetical protein
MPNESVLIARVEINGFNIEDFNSVTPGAFTAGKQVELMNKTNFGRMTPRYTFQINFVEPADGYPVDIENIKNGTCTIEYDNGKRITYGDVNTMEVGEGAINGTDEYNYPITYSASSRTPE